jgi:rhamnogalacturonyl hydrolase YesR
MKNTFNLLKIFVLAFLGFYCKSEPARDQGSTDTEKSIRAVADGVLKDATFQFVDQKSGKRFASPEQAPVEAQLRPESAYTDWRYWNGVLNIAMIKLGEALDEPAYIEFARKNIAFNFDNYRYFENKHKGESKWEYPFGQRFIMEELDDCGAMGASVIEVYRQDQQERFRNYIDQTAEHILKRQHRIEDSTLVRSFPHKWTLWADDLYMSLSFLSRMDELTSDGRYFDDAAQQVINFHKYLFDEQMGLMHHFWYSDVDRRGVAFWGRANGWAMLAQIDLLERLPKDHPQRDTLLALLRRHILGIARYQSGEGLWHQLLDKADSYLETSCSAMFTYVIARAINQGYLEPRYASVAQHGWEGVMSRIRSGGQVEGVCAGTGVSDDLVHYYRRPTPINDLHGIGAILLAGAEVLQLSKHCAHWCQPIGPWQKWRCAGF